MSPEHRKIGVLTGHDEMKLSEGITAQKDGKVTLKDGTEVNLEDGKMVTLEGKVVDTPPQVAAKVPAGAGDSPSTFS